MANQLVLVLKAWIFDFLHPIAPWMCICDTETQTESIYKVNLRDEGPFSMAPD